MLTRLTILSNDENGSPPWAHLCAAAFFCYELVRSRAPVGLRPAAAQPRLRWNRQNSTGGCGGGERNAGTDRSHAGIEETKTLRTPRLRHEPRNAKSRCSTAVHTGGGQRCSTRFVRESVGATYSSDASSDKRRCAKEVSSYYSLIESLPVHDRAQRRGQACVMFRSTGQSGSGCTDFHATTDRTERATILVAVPISSCHPSALSERHALRALASSPSGHRVHSAMALLRIFHTNAAAHLRWRRPTPIRAVHVEGLNVKRKLADRPFMNSIALVSKHSAHHQHRDLEKLQLLRCPMIWRAAA